MTALIAKDLRLAYDALLRWAVVVIGIIVASMAVPVLLPQLFGPGETTTTITLLGFLLASTCGATAAWVTISVLIGDRIHHGATLAAVLPVGRIRLVAAKSIAIAVGCAIPTVTSILCTIEWNGADAWWIISHALAGVGFAIGVAPFVKHVFEGVALAILVGAGCAAAALLGMAGLELIIGLDLWDIENGEGAMLASLVIPSAVKSAGVLVGVFGSIALVHPIVRAKWAIAALALLICTVLIGMELTFLGHSIRHGGTYGTGAPINGVFR